MQADPLFVAKETHDILSRSKIYPGDILISIAGTIGRAGVVSDDASEMNCNQAVAKIRTLPKVDRRFLVHWFNSRGAKDQINKGKVTATISNLSLGEIGKFQIPLPPLDEQRRIAAILDKADALRRKRKRALDLLDGLTQSIFLEMFGARDAWLRSGDKTLLFEISSPRQWKTISALEMTARGYPVYGANGKIGFYSSYNHEDETILITCRGATCGTINVCEPRSYVTGNAMALDDLDLSRVTIDFLITALRVRGVDDAITGTAQPQITRQSLAAVSIPLSTLENQKRFSKRVVAVRRGRPRLIQAAEHQSALFASLQSRAFSGPGQSLQLWAAVGLPRRFEV